MIDGNLYALNKYLSGEETAERAQEAFEVELEQSGLMQDFEELQARYDAIADTYEEYEFNSFMQWIKEQ